MTGLSRRRELKRSIEEQIVAFARQGPVAPQLARLLLEYVDRAHGFACLEQVPDDEFAESDHVTLIVLASRALLAELRNPRSDSSAAASSLLHFRAALGSALLTPDAATLRELHQHTAELASALVSTVR